MSGEGRGRGRGACCFALPSRRLGLSFCRRELARQRHAGMPSAAAGAAHPQQGWLCASPPICWCGTTSGRWLHPFLLQGGARRGRAGRGQVLLHPLQVGAPAAVGHAGSTAVLSAAHINARAAAARPHPPPTPSPGTAATLPMRRRRRTTKKPSRTSAGARGWRCRATMVCTCVRAW